MSSNTKFCIIKPNLISQCSEYSFSMHFGDFEDYLTQSILPTLLAESDCQLYGLRCTM